MITSHRKLDLNVNVEPLKKALTRHGNLFGQYPYRADFENSPHAQMNDIWVRYNDVKPCIETGDFSTFANEHDSIWYDCIKKLPEVIKPIFEVMHFVNGERLGGVLITRLPPGGEIKAHTDSGWHAKYYDKYYLAIKNKPGSNFHFDDGVITPEEGEVYWFNNSKRHWVINDTKTERIAMIVCIRGTL